MTPRSFRTRHRRVPLAVTVVLGALFLVLGACGGSDTSEAQTSDTSTDTGSALAGYERTPEPAVGEISLPSPNHGDGTFTFSAEANKLLMVNFGYSSCPDVCPTTLADARLAFRQLGDVANDVDYAFVSIDPERDTDQVLSDYVEAFITNGIAVRTDDQEQLMAAADAFGVTYFVGENDNGDLEVAHTPHTYLVNDEGAIILTWPFGVQAADLASDLRIMLEREQTQ